MSVLFIQKRPIRAGAQTSLARLVDSAPLRPLEPAALIGGEGWLSQQLSRHGVPFVATPFPSPRGFLTRLFGLDGFARRVKTRLEAQRVQPAAVIANDHQECPLALAIARAFGGLPVLAILRTPGMTRADFDKYHCERCDGLMGEGWELRERVADWTTKKVSLFEEGFTESEFMPSKPYPLACPRRLLVIGSEAPRKGFTDFIAAIHQIEAAHSDFPGFHCDLTGTRPEAAEALLNKPSRSSFHFLGRVEGFAHLVREYDLAVHPSRAETFGMAPIEAILAGTPTLVSITGVVGHLDVPAPWAFSPGDVSGLADRLIALWRQWPHLALDVGRLQTQIRRSYHIDHTAGFVRDHLASLGVR